MDRENEVSKTFKLYFLGQSGAREKNKFQITRPYSEIRPTKLTNHTARPN